MGGYLHLLYEHLQVESLPAITILLTAPVFSVLLFLPLHVFSLHSLFSFTLHFIYYQFLARVLCSLSLALFFLNFSKFCT